MKSLKENFPFWVCVVAALVVVSGICISIILPWEQRGIFGDMFGMVTALFTGIAFAGIVVTMYQQRSVLESQRNELELQRSELELQRKGIDETCNALKSQNEKMVQVRDNMEEQQKTSKLLCFEGMFSQFLREHREILNGLSSADTTNTKGVDVLVLFQKFIKTNPAEINKIPLYYKIEHYLNHLNMMIRFIDGSELIKQNDERADLEKRYYYISIIREGLTHDEASVLYFNNLLKGNEMYKELCEKYAMFLHLSDDWQNISKIRSGYSDLAHVWDIDKRFE